MANVIATVLVDNHVRASFPFFLAPLARRGLGFR
tara:strand:+ start:2964 stop:3065 length:102 start_codon:yes stop_codon:yes gene_type:complete